MVNTSPEQKSVRKDVDNISTKLDLFLWQFLKGIPAVFVQDHLEERMRILDRFDGKLTMAAQTAIKQNRREITKEAMIARSWSGMQDN